MTFEPLALSHQVFVQNKLEALPTVLSEYSFANCFFFRKSYGDQIHVGTYSAILTSTYNEEEVLTPLDPLTPKSITYYKQLKSSPLYPIPDEWLALISDIPHTKRAFAEDSDYLYTLEKMRTLPGRNLAKKRNLIHQFLKHYPDHEVRALTADTQEDAISVLENWHRENEEDMSDYEQCREALVDLKDVPLIGRIVYIAAKPAGFILGAMQQNAFIALFMKALREYKGIYPFLYKELALSLPDSVQWLNLGQDLGLASLMQAKKSYLPDQIALKWRISF